MNQQNTMAGKTAADLVQAIATKLYGEAGAGITDLIALINLVAAEPVRQMSEAATLRRAAAVLYMWEGNPDETNYMGDFNDACAILELLADHAPVSQEAEPEAVWVRDELRERAEFEAWAKCHDYDITRYEEEPNRYLNKHTRDAWDSWQAALAATGKQQVGEVQGDALDTDRVLSLADVHAEESREDGVRLLDRGGLLAFAQDVAAALAARQPVQPVLWCMHILGPDDVYPAPTKEHAELAAKALNAFHAARSSNSIYEPKMEAVVAPWPHSAESHAADVAKFIPEWIIPASQLRTETKIVAPPAQAVDLGPVRSALQAAEALCVCCASVDGYSRSELNAFGQNMRSQFRDALALIDGKAVQHG